ncbi:hypothetical protein GON09_001887 [Rhodococcus sp. B50]|nr:hypothetical protein [Rhodococcus sp. B50]
MAPRFVGYGGLLGDAFRRGIEADERVVELRVDRQDLSEAEELERACRGTSVCDNGETDGVGGSLGQLDQQSDTHRSEEINTAEVDDQPGDVGVEEPEGFLLEQRSARHVDFAGDGQHRNGTVATCRKSHMWMRGQWIVHLVIMQDRADRCTHRSVRRGRDTL